MNMLPEDAKIAEIDKRLEEAIKAIEEKVVHLVNPPPKHDHSRPPNPKCLQVSCSGIKLTRLLYIA